MGTDFRLDLGASPQSPVEGIETKLFRCSYQHLVQVLAPKAPLRGLKPIHIIRINVIGEMC